MTVDAFSALVSNCPFTVLLALFIKFPVIIYFRSAHVDFRPKTFEFLCNLSNGIRLYNSVKLITNLALGKRHE